MSSNSIGIKRFGPLDGLRGIAVLIVFFSHTSGRDMYLHDSLRFHGIGHIGVYLFFCLSAYLLVGKLLEKDLNKEEIKNFFIKRIFRIWPLYFIVLLIVCCLQFFDVVYDEKYLHIKNGFTGVWQHFVFYRGDSVFWSVVVEEQFYIIVPFLVLLLVRKMKLAIALFILVIVVNFMLYFSHYFGYPFNPNYIKYISTNDRMVGNYLDIFLLSTLFVFAAKKNKYYIHKYKKVFNTLASLLFMVCLILTLILVSSKFLVFEQPFYKFRYLTVLYVSMFMPFIVSIGNGNRLNILLNNWLLRKIGLYGFSIYLLHFFVFQFVNYHINLGPELKFGIASVILAVLVYLSYSFIEKPFIDLSYKIIESRK